MFLVAAPIYLGAQGFVGEYAISGKGCGYRFLAVFEQPESLGEGGIDILS